MDRLEEIKVKHERVRQYLHAHQLDGVLLSSVANFAWFTGGGDSHVENHNKFGIASLFVTKDKSVVITNNIEADRVQTEQLAGTDELFDFAVFPWYDPAGEMEKIRTLSKGLSIAADSADKAFPVLDGTFNHLRYQLTPAEVDRLRWLSNHAAKATEKAAREIQPGMTEHEIEGLIAQKLTAASILPVVILVAADHRNQLYRHPVPTTTTFHQFAKLVTCSRKWGLIVSLTRLVHAGAVSEDLRQRQEATAFVDAVFTHETKPGVRVGDIVDAAKLAYEQAGYKGEWQHHHQGGAIGYEAREYIGISESNEIVLDPQGFAWNPSIGPNKSEDSILVTGTDTEILTETGEWPQIEVEYKGSMFHRPAILEI